MEAADFEQVGLEGGVELYIRRDRRFKSARVDLFLPTLLREKHNTRLALIGRLLERGTRSLPDLQSLNRFLDDLYGAGFGAEVELLGDFQILHLGLEVVAGRFLPGGEDLLERGARFLREALCQPFQEGEGFSRAYLRQEKSALALHIRSLFNDKTAYAQRRCLEEMCRGEPCALPAHGDARDFRGISARNLLGFHRRLLARGPIAVFATGQVDPEQWVGLCRELFDWERAPEAPARPSLSPAPATPREICETQEVSQARLVLGYRTGIALGHEDYPSLALFNALLGGDAQSRLFRRVREEAGLCYYIASHLEPLCGLLFIEAGIEGDAYARAREQIDAQVEALRQGEIAPGELERARGLLRRGLWTLDDSREGLVRFYYQQRLAGCWRSRRQVEHRLEGVSRQDVARAAGRVALDTAFFLCPAPGAPRQ